MPDAYVGEIRMFAGDYAPVGWVPCDGQELPVQGNERLAELLSASFPGSSPDVFKVPDLRGRVPVGAGGSAEGTKFTVGEMGGEESVKLTAKEMPTHRHRARAQSTGPQLNTALGNVWADRSGAATYAAPPADRSMDRSTIESTGGTGAHENMMPYLALTFIMSTEGPMPTVSSGRTAVPAMLGEVRLFAVDTVPAGWVQCDGQLLDIADHQALFSLIGTSFGGDGQRTFAVPDMRGRVALQLPAGREAGKRGGSERHTLALSELPAHTHIVKGSATVSGAAPASAFPSKKVWGPVAGTTAIKPFGANPDVFLHRDAITDVGDGASHNNMQPYLTVAFCLNVRGIYPETP